MMLTKPMIEGPHDLAVAADAPVLLEQVVQGVEHQPYLKIRNGTTTSAIVVGSMALSFARTDHRLLAELDSPARDADDLD